jgi:hypothetical protein
LQHRGRDGDNFFFVTAGDDGTARGWALPLDIVSSFP